MDRRDQDREETGEKVLLNVRELVVPYIEKIKTMKLNPKQLSYMDVLESNLNDIISPFLYRLSTRHMDLTPTECKIAHFVKEGRKTRDIAKIMGLSKRTIDFHRYNIRKKLGMKGKASNLRKRIMSFQQ